MSPASQGTLEVERYIGSCLISSNVRTGTHKAIINKKLDQNNLRGKNKVTYCAPSYSNTNEQCSMQYGSSPGGWAGAPLISMTSSPRRCNQRSSPSLGQQQQNQLQSPQQQQQQSSQQQQLQSQQSQHQQQQSQQQHQQHQQIQACEAQPPQQQQLNGHLHKSPLSRLAIHTQGAPLILAGRFHNRGKVHAGNGVPSNLALGAYVQANGNSATSTMNGSTMNTTRCQGPPRARRPIESTKKATSSNSKPDCSTVSKDSTGTNIANIDSLSIASDESSGSNNSENSLPRIIKPRKRRKKDRKPPNGGIVVSSTENSMTKSDESQHQQQQQQQQHHHQQQHQQHHHQQQHQQPQQQRTSPNAITDLKPYASNVCYDQQQRYEPSLPVQQRNHRRPPIGRESVYGSCRTQVSANSMQVIGDIRQQRYAHRHVQVKVLDDNRNVLVPGTMRAIQSKTGYRPHNHHHHHHHHHHHVVSNNNNNNNNNNNGIASRYVHQDYNDVLCEDSLADGLGLCQCRYCDPSGLIWDVDQNGYSPYLTAPTCNDFCNQYHPQQAAMFLSRSTSLASQDRVQQQHQNHQQQQATIERLFDAECPRLTRPDRDTSNAVILRRSWSDPTSYFSDEIATPSKDVGVIGDRGQSENGKRCAGTFWHGDTASAGIGANANGNVSSSNNNANNVGPTSPSSKGLEVSTEIVTSPNGHRDLEIKFYSPSPNAPVTVNEEDKSILLAEEEEEDFNDIWSYHESKLQQDFRSLLQAEE